MPWSMILSCTSLKKMRKIWRQRDEAKPAAPALLEEVCSMIRRRIKL